MIRKEQIEHQASKYANDSNNTIEWGDGWEDYNDFDQVFDAFKNGAKWADEHPQLSKEEFIKKACGWLRRNYTNYMIQDLSKYVEDVCSFDIFSDSLIDDFRKAMEE